MEEDEPTIETPRNRAAFKARLLTGNHRGIAVFLFVAVFVGAETLHEAQVALSQELAKTRISKMSDQSERLPVNGERNAARAHRFSRIQL